MMGTINCIYETPCGWCTKWDKKCDRKIGNTNSGCDHEWRFDAYYGNLTTPSYTVYRCKKCGAEKRVND